MSLGCARCGSCCEHIYCDKARDLADWTTQALDGVADPGDDDGWDSWLRNGWTDEQRDLAIERYNPEGDRRLNADFIVPHWTASDDGETWTCDAYDSEAKLCTAHDSRPPVCSGYPWYDEEPEDWRIEGLNKECSYLLDVEPSRRPEGSRPLIPLTAI